jgi:hypothetical protein
VRAAASSIANGRPSSRRHSSTTTPPLAWVRAKPGRTARARSTNNATAGEASSACTGTPVGSAGSDSAATGYSCSAPNPSTLRLVAKIATPGQRANSSPRAPATPVTCSRLSNTGSQRSSPSCSARASSGARVPARSAPTARAIPATTCSGRVTAARATNTMPAAKRSPRPSATATARRVLPTPPGPLKVTSRARSSSPPTSAISSWRPTNEVSCTGRVFRLASRVRGGGKSASSPSTTSSCRRSGAAMSLSRCAPRSRTETPSGRARATSPRVASETRTCPPWPAAAIRAARFTSSPT